MTMLTSKFTNKSVNNFFTNYINSNIACTCKYYVRSVQKSWKTRDFFSSTSVYLTYMYMTKHEKIDGINKINFNNPDTLRHKNK